MTKFQIECDIISNASGTDRTSPILVTLNILQQVFQSDLQIGGIQPLHCTLIVVRARLRKPTVCKE